MNFPLAPAPGWPTPEWRTRWGSPGSHSRLICLLQIRSARAANGPSIKTSQVTIVFISRHPLRPASRPAAPAKVMRLRDGTIQSQRTNPGTGNRRNDRQRTRPCPAVADVQRCRAAVRPKTGIAGPTPALGRRVCGSLRSSPAAAQRQAKGAQRQQGQAGRLGDGRNPDVNFDKARLPGYIYSFLVFHRCAPAVEP